MNMSRKIALVALVALAATVLFAQGKPKVSDSQSRTIRGTVVDKDESPVDSGVVYLKNVHTNDIVTHLSESAYLDSRVVRDLFTLFGGKCPQRI